MHKTFKFNCYALVRVSCHIMNHKYSQLELGGTEKTTKVLIKLRDILALVPLRIHATCHKSHLMVLLC